MIYLISPIITIKEIKKKTRAEFFRDLVVGDRLEFSTQLKNPGHGRGLYATTVTIKLVGTDLKTNGSISQICNVLENFELVE